MKFILSCIIICVYECLALKTGTNKNGLRISGGRNATEDEFPYVVRLMWQSINTYKPEYSFFCTGSVLLSTWTLTAAHCATDIHVEEDVHEQTIKAVVEYRPSPKAEAAYSDITSTRLLYGMAEAVGLFRNDIALLHTQPVLLAKYGKLSPIDYTALSGQVVSVVGYGATNTMDESIILQVMEAMVEDCSDWFKYAQICFAPPCGARGAVPRAICPGDSGGPAVHASGIVSVSSTSDNRDCYMKNPVMSRRDRYDIGYYGGSGCPVSPYVDWISTVMRAEIAV